jgi:hypothetical protein
VEKVWTPGANPVENLSGRKNVDGIRRHFESPGGHARLLRDLLRLIACNGRVRSLAASSLPLPGKNGVTVYRFEELIGGRTYHIEVTPVSNRWRAQIRRIPRKPTALMPFYGATPDEAARQLSQWLMLANGRHAVSSPGAATTSTL